MAHKEKTYWPHMIVGFIMIGIALGYWTVKSTAKLPVQKSNDFMMEYHQADTRYNEIMEKKRAFDAVFSVELVDKERRFVSNPNSNVTPPPSVILRKGSNTFRFLVKQKDGALYKDANVTFLLTRPHTRVDDITVYQLPFKEGHYVAKDINISKPGRYEVRLRIAIDKERVGFYREPAYLEP